MLKSTALCCAFHIAIRWCDWDWGRERDGKGSMHGWIGAQRVVVMYNQAQPTLHIVFYLVCYIYVLTQSVFLSILSQGKIGIPTMRDA